MINLFISYSHDDKNHENWVLKLASDLKSHGVNVVFDQWDLRLGRDLRFFMENGLSTSNVVLCVCSQNYVKKVDSGIGGAGYEGMIMTQAMLQNANIEHVIPIIRNNPLERKVPLAFGSKKYIDFSDDLLYLQNYQQLLERIYGEDQKKVPPLGQNPFSDKMGKDIDVKTRIESVLYHSPASSGKVIFRYDNNNGNYIIGNGEYAFTTHWSRSGNNSIHAYGEIGFLSEASEIPEYKDLISFDYSSNVRTIQTGQIVIFRNEHSHFAAIKMGTVKSSSHGFPYDEMEFEYKIYQIS